jgi:hypothetical protein
MADFEKYCGSDLEIRAGDRRSYKSAGWLSENLASEGMCNWSICGASDVREWFAAANSYITKKFQTHFEDYKNQISMRQGAPNADQIQVINAANSLLKKWEEYVYYYERGGGGPVGSTFQNGGYSWETPDDADPKGPSTWDFISGDTALALSKEIVDFYHDATCLRDRFNETRPEGMLQEVPDYGKVTTRPNKAEEPDSIGAGAMLAAGVGVYLLIQALRD